ncbi:sulfurtransferase TusA family protein [Devosia sp. Root436]|uniref:sulfurtransferase TusA family protein n=1 Tax=Devosia sp. Root436 TaxID=1736537 RepID=UPI000B05C691|nr:sulfurtransferase TusA family protein [Devosia sp. Root436]
MTTDPQTIDARGLKCPLPVLKMEKRLASLPPGASLVVLATDPMAKVDIPLFCKQNGHDCTVTTEDDAMRFVILKG